MAFQATYEYANGSFTLSLDGPVQVRDAHGVFRDVYRLRVTGDFMTDGKAGTQYLDGDLRVVSLAHCQKGSDQTCSTMGYELGWGRPPMAGYAWPRLVENGSITWTKLGKTMHAAMVPMDDAGKRFQVGSTDFSDPLEPSLHGLFEYDPGGLAPVSIQGTTVVQGRHMVDFTAKRITYEAGKRLPAIPAWPEWPDVNVSVGNGSWKGLFFPGEDQDLFHLGYTPHDAMQYILDNEEWAGNAVANGGCIQEFWLFVDYFIGPGLLPAEKSYEFYVVVMDKEGNVRRYDGAFTQGRLGGFTSLGYEEGIQWVDCTYVSSTPWPQVRADEFLQSAEKLQLERNNGNDIFRVLVGGPGLLEGAGGHIYSLGFYPPEVKPHTSASYLPYDVYMDAVRDFWTLMSMHPDDVERPGTWS